MLTIQENLSQAMLEVTSEGVMITSDQCEIVSVNKAFTEITGYSESELVGKQPGLLKSHLHNDDFYVQLWETVRQTGRWEGQLWSRRKNGEIFLAELSVCSLKDERHAVTYYVAALSDANVRLHAKVFEAASEGIMITDSNGAVLSINSAFTTVTGYTFDEMLGKTPRVLHSGVQSKPFYIKMWESIHESGGWQGEIWNRRKNGEIYPEWLSISAVYNENGDVTHYVGIFSDISERKHEEESLKFLAHHDVLTGLPNRILFYTELKEALTAARRDETKVALLFIDLDHFKTINDTLGHSIGDELLKQVAERLKNCLRSTDTIARLGGDEFTVILPHIAQQDDVIRIIRKIKEKLNEPVFVENETLFISPSIGVSVYPDDAQDTATLLKNADSAMYKAKEHRNQYRFYMPHMEQTSSRKMELDKSLRRALLNGELEVFYQSQFDISTKRVTALEALLRWRHPEFGMIPPSEFIPIAEENGTIVQIGQWVLAMACKQNKTWQEMGMPHVTIFVNLSPRQLQEPNFIDTVKQTVDASGLDYRYIGLEITEGISIHQISSVLTVLQKLKQMGIEVAVDDFGTGYSSLSYLKNYPVGILKIDKSFIDNIDSDSTNAAIVKGIVHMAEGLNVRVIAEGVETEEQLRFLEKIGCSSIQGFLLGQPSPPNECEYWSFH